MKSFVEMGFDSSLLKPEDGNTTFLLLYLAFPDCVSLTWIEQGLSGKVVSFNIDSKNNQWWCKKKYCRAVHLHNINSGRICKI